MSRIKAILFDCDGVLIDSEPMSCRALAETITAWGHPMTTHEAVVLFAGGSLQSSKDKISALGLPGEEVYQQADDALFAMFDQGVKLIPEIADLLKTCGLPVAVCSNSTLDRLNRSLGRTELAPLFNGHIYSAEQVPNAKPAPDLAFFAAERLQVVPEHAIFIDDNAAGILCGNAAGCTTVGFVGPSEHRLDHAQTLRDAGADYVVHGMAEFKELLARLA